jgi:multidrug efflux pump subunit AcrB
MNHQDSIQKGFAGLVAAKFLNSHLTPIIIFGSLILGLISVYLTPKEEEPQITVPMIEIQIQSPGLSPEKTEREVTEVLERALWGIDGVEYIYSSSKWHMANITVRFLVGESIEESLVKIHHKVREIYPNLPKAVQEPNIKSFSIDDVPFLVLTYSSSELGDFELRSKIAPIARELSATSDLSRIELLGGLRKTVRISVDPGKMKSLGLTLPEIVGSLKGNRFITPVGKNWSSQEIMDVEIGNNYQKISDIASLPVAQRGGRIIQVRDLAMISEGPEERTRTSRFLDKDQNRTTQNAVSIVFAKRKGTNIVTLTEELLERAEFLGRNLPPSIHFSVIRNYGETANAKSIELIEHLFIATISVTILIGIWMGFRSALVVAIAIPVTLALTLAIYYFMGYTLNRVTLFALIFSIGILVDDAIVVVENIERHLKENPNLGIVQATLNAVAEVGNPTILATFTVIAAILPMAFVRGMMGPYMKPIPVGASLAMILSLMVAFIVTPWAAVRMLVGHSKEGNALETEKRMESNMVSGERNSVLDKIYLRIMNWLLKSKFNSIYFGTSIIVFLFITLSLFAFKLVKVKMLPFDNKDEFQILLDYPPGFTLDQSLKESEELSQKLLENENIERIQIFAGEPAPFSFSGMVKHSFMRSLESMNDLHIVLKEKSKRKESSHEIIESLRPVIHDFTEKKNAIGKVLEIPPGPPVLATLVAEIYGPSAEDRRIATEEIYEIFQSEPSVVDLDTSLRTGRTKIIYPVDYEKAGLLGVQTQALVDMSAILFRENLVGEMESTEDPETTGIYVSIPNQIRSSAQPFQDQNIRSWESGIVSAESILGKPSLEMDRTLHRKNLKPVSYVTAELSGSEEAPVYGILKLEPQIPFPTQTAEVPWNTSQTTLKWDGEWFITYEVFRDLGGAFAIVILLIYVLVSGWFKSYSVPLVIMAPIPISLIGIIPGHLFLNAYFTATSMIGFIAGAGIIVRNSIILVDFIEEEMGRGKNVYDAVIEAGIIRFRPMLLTAAAVVVGSFVMLFDPIFQGLAISLIFGEIAATILSRFAVPVLYYWFLGETRANVIQSA